MELSLQSRINYKSIHEKREKMITEEKLHIQDAIQYEKFFMLYKKYGEGLSEKDFARYFLDIDYASYYRLQAKIRDTATILEREFYLDEELDNIRKCLIQETGLKKREKINYYQLMNLYEIYGGRFSLKTFAEEALDLNAHRVDDLNFNKEILAVILKKEEVDNKKIIREIRDNIANNETKLHMNSKITLTEFEELYQKYVGKSEIDKKTFALKVLGISNDVYIRFEKGKRDNATIFSTYPINPEYITNLRERVILSEKLHIDDSISPQKFDELYEKYAGVLTQELFAEEILDTSIDTVKNSRRRKNNITILGKIEIPEEYINELKEKVISDNNLKFNELKSLEQIEEFYQKYGYILSRKQFATLILGIPDYNYDQLNNGSTQRSSILVDNEQKDFIEIRKRVITENNLHYDDEMSYKELHELHQRYAPTVKEHIFAERILDISSNNLNNLRNNKENAVTHILLSQELPKDEELEELKKFILEKYRLHRREQIDYKRFKKIYNKHAGILPEDMFAEKILDIQNSSLKKLKYVKKSTTRILLRTFPSKEDLKALKQKVRIEEAIYPGKQISLEEFEKYFNEYNHILSRNEFSNIILKIHNENLRKITAGEVETVSVGDVLKYREKQPNENTIEKIRQCLVQNLSIEQIAGALFIPLKVAQRYLEFAIEQGKISLEECRQESVKKLLANKKSISTIKKITGLEDEEIKKIISNLKEEEKKSKRSKNQKEKRLDYLEKRAYRIVEDYSDIPKNINQVKEYIELFMEKHEAGKISEEQLLFLKECIIFTQGGAKTLEFFSRVCINQRKYDFANRFISENLYNEGITREEQTKLRQLQIHLKHATKREQALGLLLKGEQDIEKLQSVGITVTEAVNLKNRFLTGNLNEPEKLLDD